MSTQVNITVDRGGLLQRNRQQATANRQAAIEGQQRQQLQRQAEQQRRERLQQEANERARRRRNFVREEPAANRNAALAGQLLLVPTKNYASESIGIPVLTKGVPGLQPANTVFFRRNLANTTDFIFRQDGGPAGASYLEASYNFEVNASAINLATLDPAADSQIAYQNTLGNLPTSLLPYPEYDPKPPAKKQTKISAYKQFTVEGYVRIGGGDAYALGQTSVASNIDLGFPGCTLSFGVGGSASTGAHGDITLFLTGVNSETATAGYNPLSFDGDYLRVDYFDEAYLNLYAPANQYSVEIPNLGNGVWHHFAVVKDAAHMYFFLNGILRCKVEVSSYYDFAHTFSRRGVVRKIQRSELPFQFLIESDNYKGVLYPSEIGPSAIHGLRLTPKALYADTFSPPGSIIGF